MAPSPKLFDSFSKLERNDWIKAASAEIGNKNPFESLAWQVADLQGRVIYDRNDNEPTLSFTLPVSGNEFLGPRAWFNLPKVIVSDESKANEVALHHLNHGADGVWFDLAEKQDFSLDNLLHSIDWPYCMIAFQIDESTALDFSDSVKKYISHRNFNPEALHGFVATQTYPHNPQSIHKIVHNLSPLKKFRSVGISVPPGSPVQSVASTLVQLTELIALSRASGLSVDEIFKVFFISIEIGPDFFIEIARLKSLRLLWLHLGAAYGLQTNQIPDLFIHATSAPQKNPTFEPHENMLKGTLSAMAAIAGGCNALTVLPEEPSDKFQERIARNVSNLLREESHFNKVADATAGSYYVETLVNEISRNAWTAFQKQTSNS